MYSGLCCVNYITLMIRVSIATEYVVLLWLCSYPRGLATYGAWSCCLWVYTFQL